jgi:hypothetical protein
MVTKDLEGFAGSIIRLRNAFSDHAEKYSNSWSGEKRNGELLETLRVLGGLNELKKSGQAEDRPATRQSA